MSIFLGAVKTDRNIISGYPVEYFKRREITYAYLTIPTENSLFFDDIRIEGAGKTKISAYNDLKKNYQSYLKSGNTEQDQLDRYNSKRPKRYQNF